MSKGIQFDDGKNEFHIKSRRIFGDPETPTMIRLLLKSRIVKNEKQALYVLLAIIIVALSATFLLYRNLNSVDEGFIDKNGNKTTLKEYAHKFQNNNSDSSQNGI